MKIGSFRAWLLVSCVVAGSVTALGQSAQITVIDTTGAAVPGAHVSVSSSLGTAIQSLVTDGSGKLHVEGLPGGSYAVEIIARGFEKARTTVQIPSKSPQTVQLAVAATITEITVTANRFAVEDVGTSLQFVTAKGRDQLVQRPLATIANALEGAPGVTIQQTTQSAASPILRGQTGYQTLLLLDGIRFNTSIFRSGPNQYIALIDPSAAERVEVTLGPSSANYGSDSMGGTINVLSQPVRLATQSGRREVHGEYNVLGSSADMSVEQSARVNVGSNRLAFLLGASVTRTNDLRAGKGDDSHHVYRRYFDLNRDQLQGVYGNRLQDTGFLQYSADATVGAHIAPDQTLTLRYIHSDLRNGRSYRDTWGGANRMTSLFIPQDLNFAFGRYEKTGLGPLDSLSATVSLNRQNDGSILKGGVVTDIETTDRSTVTAKGYNSQATAHIGRRQAVAFGGEVFDERIASIRFNFNPVSRTRLQDRALYPNNSRYVTTGLFVQDSIDLWQNRLRASAGLRYTGVQYTTRAADNIDANGVSLGVTNTSRTFNDVTFNTGLQWSVNDSLALNGTVARGFRAPNVTDLGGVGARTLGYDVTSEDALAVGALLGADASDNAVPTGRRIGPLKPETLLSYEIGFRFQTSKLYVRSHFYDSELRNPISSRTLLFPANQVPAAIGDVAVTPIAQNAAQRAQGVVAVVTNLVARSVKTATNDGKTRYFGTDNTLRYRLDSQWTIAGNYSFMGGLDFAPLRPTRRLPPQEGGLRILYTPSGHKPWFELGIRASGAQNRMNSGDIDDDRVGASRGRTDIATFFRSFSVSRQIGAGADGRIGTADDLFTPTGETLRQIQDRVLPLNAVVNGTLVAADATRVPLYTRTPGWTSVSIRGGYALSERASLTFGVNNLFDRNYRSTGSGVDAPGVNAFAGVRYLF